MKLGHQVTVLTARYADLPAECVEDGIRVRRIKCLRRLRDRCTIFEMATFVLSALLSVVHLVPRIRPRATIAFFSVPCGPIALLAKALFRIPYVVSLRGGDVPGLVPEIATTHRILQPMRRASLDNAVAVVANANGLRALSQAHDPSPVRVIPNGVDAEYFHPGLPGSTVDQEPFRIVFTGRFQTQKNIPLLLEACAALRAQRSPPFELHLVGDGPLRSELQKQADRLGLTSIMTWHGWSVRDELCRTYQRCHCFVNPSFYEGMPNAVLEAMACGLPVVASDIPGNDALVQHGVTGFLFSLDEPAVLGNHLLALINDRPRAADLGRRGRARVEREFSWSSVAASYVQLFQTA